MPQSIAQRTIKKIFCLYFIELERRDSLTNFTAQIGASIVLNCPYDSIPEANIIWSFSNGTIIDTDQMHG